MLEESAWVRLVTKFVLVLFASLLASSCQAFILRLHLNLDLTKSIFLRFIAATRFLFETSVYNEWRGTFSFASSHFFFPLLCPCCWYSTSTWCYQVCNRWRPTRQQHVIVEKRIHKALIIVLVWFCRFTLHCFSTLTNLCAGFIFHLWMRP